jgi:non-ribosomal peptide synthetase component F
MIEPGIIDRMRGIGQQGLGHVILAAYGALLSRLSGREEAVIVTAAAGRGEGGVVPLKLQVSWDLSFRSFVEQVAKKIEHAAEHNLYSAPILTNPWRMALHGAAPPIFDVGYWHGSGRENSSPARIHESLRLSPEPEQGVSLALQVADRPGDTRLTFSYQKRFFSPDTIERLAYYLESLFKEVGDNPDIALGDITLGSESGVSNVAVTIDAAEEFNF